jgi:glycosyltransferase involved in cell wall biosynthesis
LAKGWKYLLQYIFWFPFEIIILRQVLKRNQFDIVHVSGGSWQIKGVVAGKFAGCQVLWHLNDTGMPGIIRSLFRLIARCCADGFIVAGERVRKYYVEELGFGDTKPVFEIQAPVDCSYFDAKKVKPDETISGIEAIKIVSVGNINPVKGFVYFLDMAKLLNQRYVSLHFFIIGPHWQSQRYYSKKLEQIKEDKNLKNLTFFGPSSDVRRIHKAADIYVCSSIAEASPLSVWEAMAMEKAVVATDVGDISRFITHGENGFIVPPADPEALAYYVGKLVDDKVLREKFGRKARLAALENLDISIAAKKHVEAYQWAVNR